MGFLLPGTNGMASVSEMGEGLIDDDCFSKDNIPTKQIKKKVEFSKEVSFGKKDHRNFIIDEEEDGEEISKGQNSMQKSIKTQLSQKVLDVNSNASQFSLMNSKAKKKAEIKKQNDKQVWIKLQTQITYSPDCLNSFPSIKDVYSQRVQFDKKQKDLKTKIEQRQRLTINELTTKYKQKYVAPKFENFNIKEKKQYQKVGFDGDQDPAAKEDHEEITGWRKDLADYEDRIALIKDDCTFFVHGKHVKFSKRSLGMLDNKNKIRIALVWLITSKWFENFIISLILINSLFLGMKDYTDKENVTPINKFVEFLEPFFMYIFLGECVSKVLAMGLILGSKCYLRDAWNWLDFMVVVTSLLTELPSMQNMSGLRTFRLFRPLRSLTTMPSMKLLIGTLMSSVSHLGGILGLAMFFFMIFAILGVSLLNGAIHYRCFETQDPLPDGSWILVKDDYRLCSSQRICPIGFCNSLMNATDMGFKLQEKNLWKDTDIFELNYGITNFDNIGWSFLTIFQCITEEDWTHIMNIYQDAYSPWFIKTFFISSVVICSFFLLNLTIAVMLMKYEELDKNQANSKHKEELRQIGVGIKLPPALIEFMINQNSIQLSQHAKKMLKQEDSFFKQLFAPKKQIVDKSQSYYQNFFVKICLKIVMNPYFDGFILLVIIVNTICQAMDQYPDLDNSWLELLQWGNQVFTVIFTIEVLLKMIGLGIRCFFQEKFNQFDLVIVIISLVEMEMQNKEGQGVFSAMRAFRLFKIFKLFKVGDLRILIDSITFTMTAISDYCILLCLFIYVFALIGMSFFAGALKFDDTDHVDRLNGSSPRKNFDHIQWSIITIFQVLLGEKWQQIMYSCIRSVHPISACYFILLVLTGNIIMLNLFLAILLGNFEKARNFGQKKKVFEAFREIMMNDRSLNQALDIILCDMSIYAKIKILNWDEKMVNRIHNKGDSQIAQDLMENGAKFIDDDFSNKSDEEPFEDNNMSMKLLDLSHFDNESNVSIDNLDDTVKEPKFNKKPLKKQVADFQKYEKPDHPDGYEKKEFEDSNNNSLKNEIEKPKKFALTTVKYHKFNPKLLRLQEMNRTFCRKPTETMKAILEKELDLDPFEMDLFNKESMIELYSGLKTLQESLKKKVVKMCALSTMVTKQNIQMYQNSDLLKTNVNNQNYKNQFYLQKHLEKQITRRSIIIQKTQEVKISTEVKPKKKKQSKKTVISDNSNLNIKEVKISERSSQVSYTEQSLKHKKGFRFGSVEPPDDWNLTSDQMEINSSGDQSTFSISTIFQRLFDRFQYSSLFIFHKDTKLRKYCLLLAESAENIEDLRTLELHRKRKLETDSLDGDREMILESDANSDKKSRTMVAQSMVPEDGDEMALMMKHMNNAQDDDFMNKKLFNQHPSKFFENLVLTLIVLSGIAMMVDNPLDDPNGNLQAVLAKADIIFTCLFTIEASIKIIAKGLMFNNLGPVLPYLKSYWNLLDAFVVAASLLDLITRMSGINMQSLQALKALRSLRALRPLRMISRNEGMRLVTNALLASLPSMTNVLLVCSLFILIFGIMGVGFFKGQFYSCQDKYDSDVKIDLNLVDTKQDCLDLGGLWLNKNSNFDNTPQAMNTLFQMTTTEGWVDVMYSGIDSRGVDLQPKKDENIITIIYFIAFMVMGSQFIINLFVGVVIDNFNTIKEKEELGNMFVTEQQKSWIEIQKVGLNKKLRTKVNEPTDWRLTYFKIIKNKWFEFTITGFIVLNTAVMALRSYRMNSKLLRFSEIANLVFTVVFNIEMFLKLIGLGKTYFIDSWNKFDMFIVLGTDVGLLLSLFDVGGGFTTAATVIRSVRIMRMFRLIKSSVHIRLILDTILNILPQITNVMSLILLLFFIYASLAINFFSGVMLQEYLDEKNNFQTFMGSMIMFMKFSTGENWNEYMYELANTHSYRGVQCVHSQSYEDVQRDGIKGCGTWVAYPFFISFTILVSMLIMNLSVAAVIEGLDTAKKENMGIVQGDEIEILIDLWQHYDPLASGWITMTDLVFLLYELPPPLGKRPSSLTQYDDPTYDPDSKKNAGSRQQDRYLVNYEKRIVMKKVEALELLKDLKIQMHPDATKQINYVDVFKALIKRILEEQKIEYQLTAALNRKMDNQWAKKHKDVGKETTGPIILVREEQAGLIITRWARKCLNQQKNQHQKKNEMNKKRQQQRAQKPQHHRDKHEDLGKVPAHKRKKRNQVMMEQAQIIFNIIKGVNDSNDKESDEEAEKHQIKNEYSWKFQGGNQVLEELDRSNYDSDYQTEGEGENQCKAEKEHQYQDYKHHREEEIKFTNDLFSMDVAKASRHTKTFQEQRQIQSFQEQRVKIKKLDRNISINIGSLENGNNDLVSKSVYKIGEEQLIDGKRPVRDYNAERYIKESEVQQTNDDNSSPFTDPENPVVITPFEEQEQKYHHMQTKQKEEMNQRKMISQIAEQQMRPQIHRNTENFIHGSSGQTIEMNTNEQKEMTFMAEEALFSFMDNSQQDLISRPDLDHILLPSKATIKPPKNPTANPNAALSKVVSKFASGQVQLNIVNRSRQGAVCTLKPREAPPLSGPQQDNFFKPSTSPSHYSKIANNNMIIDASNFPSDINIVEKEDLIYHQTKLIDTSMEPKKQSSGGDAYRQALYEVENTIAFNAQILDEADDSLCTDESMNDIQ